MNLPYKTVLDSTTSNNVQNSFVPLRFVLFNYLDVVLFNYLDVELLGNAMCEIQNKIQGSM